MMKIRSLVLIMIMTRMVGGTDLMKMTILITVTAGDEDVPPERMGGVQGCVNALGRYYSEHPGIGSSLNFFLFSNVDDTKMIIIDRNFVTAVNICVVLCGLSGAAY